MSDSGSREGDPPEDDHGSGDDHDSKDDGGSDDDHSANGNGGSDYDSKDDDDSDNHSDSSGDGGSGDDGSDDDHDSSGNGDSGDDSNGDDDSDDDPDSSGDGGSGDDGSDDDHDDDDDHYHDDHDDDHDGYHPEEDHYLEDEDEEEEPEGKEMSFLEHLEEARMTLITCVVAILGGIVVAFVFMKPIADFLKWPLYWATPEGQSTDLVTVGPLGIFSFIIQVGFFGGLTLALPVIIYSLGKFVAPGLKENEVRYLKPVCIAAFFLFLLGSVFSFYVIIPVSMKAAMFFNAQFGAIEMWTIDSYYGLVVWMILAIGICFELPLLIIALIQMGLVSTEQLRKFRPYSFITFLVASAMITPTTDPITFLLLAGPMMVLYEGGIFVGKRIERKRKLQEEEFYKD